MKLKTPLFRLSSLVIILVLFLTLLTSSLSDLSESRKSELGRQQILGSISSAHPLATEAGMSVLQKGGNAFDAAIAVAATLNVVEPMMSGIGGYGTILIYNAKDESIKYLNPSGRFPAESNSDLMRQPTPNYLKNRIGPKSISTPGNLNAWEEMSNKYGSLPWEELFEPAINLAENGFTLDKRTAGNIKYAFEEFSSYSKGFYGNNDKALKEGDLLIQKDLAKTFNLIAKEGVHSFYHGEIADKINQQMIEVGSFLRKHDLEINTAEWWDPLMMEYRGFEVYTASLPANSFAAFVNLGLMKQFQPGEFEHNSADYLHHFAEMTKESYKARLAYSFDPEVRIAPIDSVLSDKALGKLAGTLDKKKASNFKPLPTVESKNTTHYVVIDRWGNIVSATQTLGNAFGSRVMVEGYGIWLNNSMAYATYEPAGNPMDVFPGRHKLSGDCPVIILKDSKPWAALGSPGGHTITQNVPQIIFNLIDFEMSMQEAIDAAKISFVEPDIIQVDPYLHQSVINDLESRGHKVRKGFIGNAHGIKIHYSGDGTILKFEAGVDKRGK